jgi:hypothetical protein
VKLRGRTGAPDQSRGCTLSSRTRGDTTDSHGPLQRLLERNLLIRSQTDHAIVKSVRLAANYSARRELPSFIRWHWSQYLEFITS